MDPNEKNRSERGDMMALQHSSEKIPTLACCNNYFVQWKSIEIFS